MGKKEFMYAIVGLFVIILVALSSKIFETVDSREYHVKQAAITGDLTVKGDPGVYAQMFGSIEKYPRTLTFYFSKEKLDGGDGADAAPLKATFMGNATADVDGMIKIILPSSEEARIELHRDYGNVEGLKMDLLRNTVASALKQTGPMFRPEEAFTTRRPEFTQIMSDILTNGIPATETLVDSTIEGDKVIRLTKSVLKLDSNGNKITLTESPLKKYGITITQFDIKDFVFDTKTTELIEKKKVLEQEIVAAKANAEKAKQSALTTIEDGKARVAKAEADALVNKKTAVVNAEKEAEVAKQKKLQAIEEAAAYLAKREAEAKSAKLKVAAGLTPQERAEWQYKTDVGRAEALSKWKGPSIVTIGGKSGGSGSSMLDALGIKAMMEIDAKMAK